MSAPADSTYILLSPDAALPNAFSLNSLATGIIKQSGGTPARAIPGTDYLVPTPVINSLAGLEPQSGSLLVGVDEDTWELLPPPASANLALVWDGSSLTYASVPAASSPYVTLSATSSLTNSRYLDASGGIQLTDNGAGNALTISPTGKLSSFNSLNQTGIVVAGANNQFFAREIISSDDTIAITNPDGITNDINLSVNDDISVQKVAVYRNDTKIGERSKIKFVPGVNMGISIVDDAIENEIEITLSASAGGGGGVSDANIVTLTDQTHIMPNSFALSGLNTGILKNTNGTGQPTIAVAGTDFLLPSANLTSISEASNALGSLLVATGSGYNALAAGPANTFMKSNGTTIGWSVIESSNTATFLTKTDESATYPNSFALSDLATGILKNTTTTGEPTIAVAGTDYLPPSANLTTLSAASNASGTLYIGNGSGISALALGASGTVPKSDGSSIVWSADAGASAAAPYLTLTDVSGDLPNSFAMSSLATGILKNTNGTGIPTIADANTDYMVPSVNLLSISAASSTAGNIFVGMGEGNGYSPLPQGNNEESLHITNGLLDWRLSPANKRYALRNFIISVANQPDVQNWAMYGCWDYLFNTDWLAGSKQLEPIGLNQQGLLNYDTAVVDAQNITYLILGTRAADGTHAPLPFGTKLVVNFGVMRGSNDNLNTLTGELLLNGASSISVAQGSGFPGNKFIFEKVTDTQWSVLPYVSNYWPNPY